jgi:hypothetical protein
MAPSDSLWSRMLSLGDYCHVTKQIIRVLGGFLSALYLVSVGLKGLD